MRSQGLLLMADWLGGPLTLPPTLPFCQPPTHYTVRFCQVKQTADSNALHHLSFV